MEGNGLGLHLTLLNVDLVTGEDNRDILADTDEITWQREKMSGVESGKGGRRSECEEENLRCQLGTFL